MAMVRWTGATLLCVLAGTCAAQDPRGIVLRAAARDEADVAVRKHYTYLTTTTERRLDSRGQVRSTESRTHEVMVLYGAPYRRLVARDGQPLGPQEQRKEQEKLDKELAKRAAESEKDRQRRAREQAEETEQQKSMLRELADAFVFTLVGHDTVDGERAWVIDAEPRPGYKPRSRRGAILPKVRGRIWITEQDSRWARLDAEVIDTVSFGLFLFRLHKGARMTFEQKRVHGEVWMPHRASVQASGRLGLVKRLDMESVTTWEGYRKFQSDSRLVSAEALAPASASGLPGQTSGPGR